MNNEKSSSEGLVRGAANNVPAGVLQVGPLMAPVESAIVKDYGAQRLPADEGARTEFLSEQGQEVVVAVTSGKFGVDSDLMRSLPNLKAVVNFGAGYDGTDVTTARERGIAISNTPDVLTDCVADTALGLLLDVFRGHSAADRFVRRGAWSQANFPLMTKLSGKRIGIIGLGRIGQAIARRLEAFDCDIVYHNRKPVRGVRYKYVESPVLLAATSDALVVSTAGGPDTEHLISAQVLEALGEKGYLINVSRGSVVDEKALVTALSLGKIAGAGMDVYAHEPDVPDALLKMENVVLLPHIGSGTVETRLAMAELTLANLNKFLTDGALITPVS